MKQTLGGKGRTAGADVPSKDKTVFMKLTGDTMVGPFTRAELRFLNIPTGRKPRNPKAFLRAAIATMPGIDPKHVDAGTHILYGIGELRGRGWEGPCPAPRELGEALRSGNTGKLEAFKRQVDAALGKTSKK